MRVSNLTDSLITLPTGEKILPRQVKAMPVNVIMAHANKRFVNILQAKDKLLVEPVEGEGTVQETPGRRDLIRDKRRRNRPERVDKNKNDEVPQEITREWLGYATRKQLSKLGARYKIPTRNFARLNDDDARLKLGSIIFDDPGLVGGSG